MEEGRRGRGRPPRAEQEAGAPHWPDEADDVLQVESDPGYERVIVARGRTVLTPHQTKTKVVREGEDGKPVRAPITIEHGAGAEIELDAAPVHQVEDADGKVSYVSEAQRLINLGIVHRPGEAQMIPAALSDGSRVVEIGTPRGVNQAART